MRGLKSIERRAARVESDNYGGKKTIDPTGGFLGRHYKALAFVAVETSHNTFFHFIDTVKVRG